MAWNLLLTSDIGLMSLFTIMFCLVMGAYIAYYAAKHAKQEKGSKATTKPIAGAH